MAVQIVPINPYDKSGFLLPFVIQRSLEFAQRHIDEMDPHDWVRAMVTGLCSGSGRVMMVALVGDKGDVVGHGVATIEEQGKRRWIFIAQLRVDPGEGSSDTTLVRRCIELADEWGKAHGATQMTMASPRSDEAWRKKYGFDTARHVMTRPIGRPIPGPSGE